MFFLPIIIFYVNLNFVINQSIEYMSKVCEICGKKPGSGNSRSHSNIATLRTFGINLQKKKLDGKRVKACTRCIKTANKTEK